MKLFTLKQLRKAWLAGVKAQRKQLLKEEPWLKSKSNTWSRPEKIWDDTPGPYAAGMRAIVKALSR